MTELTWWLLALYFLPNIIAYGRGHNSAHAILALNILLGWTGIGWAVAFIWGLTGNVTKREKKSILGKPDAPPQWDEPTEATKPRRVF